MPPPSRSTLYLLAGATAGALAVAGALLALAVTAGPPPLPSVPTLPFPDAFRLPKAARRTPLAVPTPLQREHGLDECSPLDPLGLGPYGRYRATQPGRIAIPQKGGHTADLGFDVLVHLHGGDPMRRYLVQVSRGVSFVTIDLGVGSSRYRQYFQGWRSFENLRDSITRALRDHTGQPGAHIRRFGVSAWSAGYGAIIEILLRHADDVDAVVLLDGLHTGWKPGTPERLRGKPETLRTVSLAPVVRFAKRAAAGEKIFIFSHSEVEPPDYASTSLVADYLVREVGARRRPTTDADEPYPRYPLQTTADRRGFHVWGYRGNDEAAHCAHLAVIARALETVIEPAWGTPRMDRSVPSTPAPVLGNGSRPASSQR